MRHPHLIRAAAFLACVGAASFGKKFMEKWRNLGDKPYYEPLELPPASTAPPK